MGTPTVEVLRITPSKAKRILDANKANRPLNRGHVQELAEIMEAGEFLFNGEPIQIADDGSLLNGQHRLTAVIESGRPMDFVVVEGLPKANGATVAVQDTIDQGVKRTVAHQLVMDGHERSYAKTLASALRIQHQLTAWIEGKREVPKSAHKYSPMKARIDLRADPDMVKYARKAEGVRRGQAKISASYTAALWRRFAWLDEVTADEFWSDFHGWDLGNEGQSIPAKKLQHAIVSRRLEALNAPSKASKVDPYWFCAMSIKAWNLHREGRRPRSLKFDPEVESFPAPK